MAVDSLRHLATLHPLSSAAEPKPQFRLFAEAGGVHLVGEVDSIAIDHLCRALRILPPKTEVVVDLSEATIGVEAARARLATLAGDGVDVTVIGPPEVVGRPG